MSQHESCFAQLLCRLRQGDPHAAQELVSQYGPHVLRIVRRALSRKLRSKFDSDDFVQAAWASFFADLDRLGDNLRLEDVAAYLGAIARNKTIEELRRRLHTRRHTVQREASWSQGSEGPIATAPAPGPAPGDAMVARETWNQLTDGRSDRSVQVFELRREGISHVEIAQRLGVHQKTVQRILDRAKRRLEGQSE
jgi:RNA polymerase sigma factor (sigma-70 family)